MIFVTAIGQISLKDETGEAVNYAYCDVWRFRRDKLAELKAFAIKALSPQALLLETKKRSWIRFFNWGVDVLNIERK